MRDVYYQPVGNPLLTDRLPSSRPSTEVISEPTATDAITSAIRMLLSCLIQSTILLLVYRAPGFAWFDPYDLMIATPIIIYGVIDAFTKLRLTVVLHPIVLCAIGVAALNHRLPWSVKALITALSFSAMVLQYGRHSVGLITTAPMPRDKAMAQREKALDELVFVASATFLLLSGLLLLNWPLLVLCAIAFPLATLLAKTPKPLAVSRGAISFRCLKLWFTYNPKNAPGIVRSAAGDLLHRTALAVLVTEMTAITILSWSHSPILHVVKVAASHGTATLASDSTPIEKIKHAGVTLLTTAAVLSLLPVLIPMGFAVSTSTPATLEAALNAQDSIGANETQAIIADIQTSPDPVERDSIFLGRVVEDGMPVLVPKKIFTEHAHGLGDSGSGKTSLFLCPLIEQLAASGDCSVIVIDLKADTLELLATLTATAEKVKKERGITLPVKCFSNQSDRSTFAFNPMTQSFWSNFDLLTRTDILCGANGLTYGTEYGQGYFSSANQAVLHHALKSFPHVKTFKELADCIGQVINSANKKELHPEIRKAGVHVQEVIKRLAQCAPLNVTDSTGHDASVVEQAIDLTAPFLSPQLLYFHLSATLSPSGAPEIGRLVNYILLAASTQTQRKHQVFLVIDEFQRMVAGNLEYMLQLARSMGVGVILANQSMEDLKKSSLNLIPPIEANCRLRQWFSVSASEDRERLINSSGETVHIEHGRKTDFDPEGKPKYSYAETEKVVPRISMNDILATSDHPFRSILRISRGAGYAQFGGLPLIIESQFHISEEEYARRRAMPWPSLPGMFLPSADDSSQKVEPTSGPTYTQDVIGASKVDPNSVEDCLDGLSEFFEPKPRRTKKAKS